MLGFQAWGEGPGICILTSPLGDWMKLVQGLQFKKHQLTGGIWRIQDPSHLLPLVRIPQLPGYKACAQ